MFFLKQEDYWPSHEGSAERPAQPTSRQFSTFLIIASSAMQA